MAKKKVKRAVSKKKAVKKSKPKAKAKAKVKAKVKAKAKAQAKEKVLGKVEHFFGKISVAAIKVLAPLKVGDYIHIKGHTTDFVQRVDSIQIEHQDVARVKKGDDIGIKVKEHVREHDLVYLADERSIRLENKPVPIQTAMFGAGKPVVKPTASAPKPMPEKKGKDPYDNTKFFSF
jgi:putative protease